MYTRNVVVFDLCWFYLIMKKLVSGYIILLITEDNYRRAIIEVSQKNFLM